MNNYTASHKNYFVRNIHEMKTRTTVNPSKKKLTFIMQTSVTFQENGIEPTEPKAVIRALLPQDLWYTSLNMSE
jgi:hypothetical protein